MTNSTNLPKKISIFPLSNFIFFPQTSIPLNIFEPRYLQMINDSIKKNRLIGMVQPKKNKQKKTSKTELYSVGCMGKIINFNETEDGRIILVLKGISRFTLKSELSNEKLYREFEVSYKEFEKDLELNDETTKFIDLDAIFDDLKKLFKRKNYILNLDEFNNENQEQTINALCMISPFSLEEKQILLESKNTNERKIKLKEILDTYLLDNFEIKTIQ